MASMLCENHDRKRLQILAKPSGICSRAAQQNVKILDLLVVYSLRLFYFCFIIIKAEEHAEDYLRELEILRIKVPELQEENLKLKADGTHVSLPLSMGIPLCSILTLDIDTVFT